MVENLCISSKLIVSSRLIDQQINDTNKINFSIFVTFKFNTTKAKLIDKIMI